MHLSLDSVNGMHWDDENENGRGLTMWLEIYSTPYVPARGPSYSCGGQPAEPAEFEVEGASIAGINGGWCELCEGHRLIPESETVIEWIEDHEDY